MNVRYYLEEAFCMLVAGVIIALAILLGPVVWFWEWVQDHFYEWND